MDPKSSRDLSGPKPRVDTVREKDEAVRKDADKTEDRDREADPRRRRRDRSGYA